VIGGVPDPHRDEHLKVVMSAYNVAVDLGDSDSLGWRYAVEVPKIR
jgi:hypothetical protein